MQVLRDAGDSGGASGSGKWDPRGRKGGTKGLCLLLNDKLSQNVFRQFTGTSKYMVLFNPQAHLACSRL